MSSAISIRSSSAASSARCASGWGSTSTAGAARSSRAELLERVVGGPLDAEPYLAYLCAKVEALAA